MNFCITLIMAIGLGATPQYKPGDQVVTIRPALAQISARFSTVIRMGTPMKVRAQSEAGLLVWGCKGVINLDDVVAIEYAAPYLTESLKTSTNRGPLFQARGNVFLFQKHFAEAEEDFGQAILLTPSAEVFVSHAVCLEARRDWVGAITDCDRAIQLSPNDPEPLSLRALAYLQIGNDEKAIADCTRGLELRGEEFELCSIRARSHLRTGQYNAVIADGNRMVVSNPDKSLGFVLRSWAYYFNKEYDNALADCTEASKLAPGDFWVASQMGAIHAASGNVDDAILWQEKALAVERENAAAGRESDDESKLGEFQNVASGREARMAEGRKRLDVYKARKPFEL